MELLFSKGKIGTMELDSRLIMTAMHTGLGLEEEADFLVERVRHGASLVTAVMGVHPSGTNLDMDVISEANKPLLSDMAARIQKAGGKLCIQLFHAGRNSFEGMLREPGIAPSAPSPVPSPIFRTMPAEMTPEAIERTCGYYGQAARICREAGVNALEISCSAGYLLSEFLSEKTNLRTDAFGGSRENRFCFPLQVIKRVREAAGGEFPVIVRISGSDMLGGYTLADMQAFARAAEPFIDAVNVTGGWHESKIPQISMQVPPGNFAFLAAAIKQAVNIPVIACNRNNNPEIAEEILREGFADFVGAARAFLADSRYVSKIKKKLPYKHCIGCNRGCIENVLRGKAATCIFNPLIGHEREFQQKIEEKTDRPEAILIVGAGPAGLTAARYLALAGHKVTVCTRESEYGGTMNYAKKAPEKEVMEQNIQALVFEAEEAGAVLVKETLVDQAYIERFAPDRVVVAAGSREFIPPIGGVDSAHVFTLKEVFDAEGETLRQFLDKKVCIIGGGASGVELAFYILDKSPLLRQSRAFLDCFNLPETAGSFDYPGNITVVEMTKKIASDLGGTRWILMKQIGRYPLTVMTEAKVLRITEEFVEVQQNAEIKQIPAELVVLATGFQPAEKELIRWLNEKGFRYNVIGDCNAASVPAIQGATTDAFGLL